MINIFDERHFDVRKKSWHIGEDQEAHKKIKETMDEFYESLT